MGTVRPEDIPHYTIEEYLLWEGNWELINGLPYAMTPAPVIEHQRISQKIARLLDEQLDECQQCHALLPVDWHIKEDTVVQPDNLVVCYKPSGTHLTKAPTLIIEILSKSTAKKDTVTKFHLYETEGVKYYIMVDPLDKVARIYQNKDGKFIKFTDATDESVSFELGKCSIDIDFSRIFEQSK